MSLGQATTWEVLCKTKNEAAVSLLMPMLNSLDAQQSEKALCSLLKRRSEVAHRELLSRWGELGENWKTIIRQQPGSMTGVLRDAVLDGQTQNYEEACEAILWLREYDLTPTLITAAEDQANPNAAHAANTLVSLADVLYEELTGPRDYRQRRDPQLVRRHVTSSLEKSVQRFGTHGRVEMIEAFFLLTGRDNATLKKILLNPHSKGYLSVIDLLSKNERTGTMRLLLSFLDDPQAPKAAINVMVNRRDEAFLHGLLKKIGFQPSEAACHNLRKVESVGWVSDEPHVLDKMDEAEQHAAIQLLMATRVNRLRVFSVVRYLLLHGNPGGRRAAAESLSSFKGAESNELVLKALDDPDPRVQAYALAQLRQRGMRGALTRLIGMIDSPHEVVRTAARRSLVEFQFKRYLAAFNMLGEEVRQSTGLLVKKVDPQTLPLLVEELSSPSRTRRLRALAIVFTIDMAERLEERIFELLQDEDHFVRAAAAQALSRCDTLSARTALRSALEDRSVAVQDAAAHSLDALGKGPPPPRELNVSNTFVIPEVSQAGRHDVESPASDRPAQGRHGA